MSMCDMYGVVNVPVVFKVCKGQEEAVPVGLLLDNWTGSCVKDFLKLNTCSWPCGAVQIRETKPRKRNVKDTSTVFGDVELVSLISNQIDGLEPMLSFMLINKLCYNQGKVTMTSASWLSGGRSPYANLKSVRSGACRRKEVSLPIKVAAEYASLASGTWKADTVGTLTEFDAKVVTCTKSNAMPSNVVVTKIKVKCNEDGRKDITTIKQINKKLVFYNGAYVVRRSNGEDAFSFNVTTKSVNGVQSKQLAFDAKNMRTCKSQGLGCVRIHVPMFDEACVSMGVPLVTGRDLVSLSLQGKITDSFGTECLYNPTAAKLPKDLKAYREDKIQWWM